MRNAGFWRRVAAMLYDGLLLFAVLMLIGTPFVAARGGEAVEPLTDPAFRLTLAATIYVFFVGFWTGAGRTLGMQSWGLQLETTDGGRPGLATNSLRFIAALISWAPCGLGFLWQLRDRDKLTWHDRISGTRIVHYPKPEKRKR
ncbi:MAG: RDD family protein [Proteobacteria bacterium]|nr:RDD family protein [Pseudomonadota bacterium]